MTEARKIAVERQVLAAFRRLRITEDASHALETAVRTMAILAGGDFGQHGNMSAFSRIGRTRVAEEIKRVRLYARRAGSGRRKGQADPVTKLRTYLRNLHGPTIDALAARGVLRATAADDPRQTAARLEKVDVSNTPEIVPGGRPANLRAQGIAKVLAWHYEQVTGRKPAVSKGAYKSSDYGPFVTLLDDVLHIAGIKANAYAVAMASRAECKKR